MRAFGDLIDLPIADMKAVGRPPGRTKTATLAMLSGLEFLRKADYDQPGSFHAASFQLSIGLERLFRLVIILDHQARHARQNPTDRQLRAVGHELAGA